MNLNIIRTVYVNVYRRVNRTLQSFFPSSRLSRMARRARTLEVRAYGIAAGFFPLSYSSKNITETAEGDGGAGGLRLRHEGTPFGFNRPRSLSHYRVSYPGSQVL